MSQVLTRKSAVSEEKEKKTESPIKDMKKKVAANVEKEKQASEKSAEKQPDKSEKPKQTEKPAEKIEKPRQAEKPTEKIEKPKQPEKPTEVIEKPTDKNEKQKQPEKAVEKEKSGEKSAEKVTDKKIEKNGVDNKKADSKEKKDDKAEKSLKTDAKKNGEKSKLNGSKQNGVDSNGVEETSDDDVLEIADDEFPELAYDDTSDNESPTPGSAPSRSFTRRSQVKATRTPETPQPADKPADADHPKDSKVLKLAETPSTDRKLRSDDPKPDAKKQDKEEEKNQEAKKDGSKEEKDKLEVIEIEADEEPRKTDTNYSKSRVKVSPYRRSTRLADQTTSSITANYTGNNTTMEMDITESSFAEDASLDDSSYLNGLRSIRGRRSYKPLKELSLKHVNRSVRSTASTSVSDPSPRPTGTVVGRKRKPSPEIELATEAGELVHTHAHTKRMRLLDRIAQPFRRGVATATVVTPAIVFRNPDIVGINTDLPLSAPAAPPLDPESLKAPPPPPAAPAPPAGPHPPAHPLAADDADRKRCVVM